jgi:hypothetical protein
MTRHDFDLRHRRCSGVASGAHRHRTGRSGAGEEYRLGNVRHLRLRAQEARHASCFRDDLRTARLRLTVEEPVLMGQPDSGEDREIAPPEGVYRRNLEPLA